ncbi:hypothetical protein EV663_10363 [Rhodovulum bhavnagarense]|uniref:Tetratricopeptide repeat-like domain-containing protein n=1 Tax=Rhodovulum bhavnagarense TaxID=992286 RepID=A0A4R2RH09_9RHOB|nr:hypothetical protein [Rhodovulum bhavnagarense]TCP61878.1 hypothetical protein EV663_10363 [Rhodovulum bhavnagarense]
MSQSDSFIEEVTEEVRREKLFAMIRRYGWIAVLAVVLLVGGASWREWSQARDRAAAEVLGDTILAALEAPEPAERVSGLDALAPGGEVRALLGLLRGGESGPDMGRADAVAALEAMADDATLPVHYTQLAALKLVMLGGRDTPPEQRLARLAPLAEPGRPYRPLALEQMALAEIDAGNTDAALAHLRTAIEDAAATAGLRQRVSQLIVALGGDPEAG